MLQVSSTVKKKKKKSRKSSYFLWLQCPRTNNLAPQHTIPSLYILYDRSLYCHLCQGALRSAVTVTVLCQLCLAAQLLLCSQSWQANMLIEFISLSFDRQLKRDSTALHSHYAVSGGAANSKTMMTGFAIREH